MGVFSPIASAKYVEDLKGSSIGGDVIDNITVIVKPKKGASVLRFEEFEIQSLNVQLQDLMLKNGWDFVPFKMKGQKYNIVKCINTPGTPKSDFSLVDTEGKEVVWISHKAGSTAKDFQQWGGVSKTQGDVSTHKETQDLIHDLNYLLPDKQLPTGTSVYKLIKDKTLKMMSVYGKDYKPGGVLGRENVTVCCQGNIQIIEENGFYTLKAKHTHFNGEPLTGPYEPVFMVTYRGDRSSFGVKNARISISPIGGRKAKNIMDLIQGKK